MEDEDIKINSLNINKLYINYQKLSKTKDTANNIYRLHCWITHFIFCAIPNTMLKRAMAERKRMQDEKDAQEAVKWAAIRAAEKAVWDDYYRQEALREAYKKELELVEKKLVALEESAVELGNSLVRQITVSIERHRSLWNIMDSSLDVFDVCMAREEAMRVRVLIITTHEQAQKNGYRRAEINDMFDEWKAEDGGRTK
jgi:hypothetical protein